MKKRVIVMDDDEDSLNLLLKLLDNDGYEVFGARNGNDGLSLIKDTRPDIMIVDLQKDSDLIINKIKNEIQNRNIKVIALVSPVIPGDKKEKIDSKADGWIERPVNPEIFISQMESIITSFRELLR